MSEIAQPRINSFAPVVEQAAVSPKESVFVLTGSQLRDIVSRAIQEATEPLYQEIAYDRQRIAKLEQREPQPLQKDRADILRALLAANGGKMLAKDARQKMRLEKATFSVLIDSMKDYIDSKPLHSDRRQSVLFIK